MEGRRRASEKRGVDGEERRYGREGEREGEHGRVASTIIRAISSSSFLSASLKEAMGSGDR